MPSVSTRRSWLQQTAKRVAIIAVMLIPLACSESQHLMAKQSGASGVIADAGLNKLFSFHCITELNLTGAAVTRQDAPRSGSKQVGNPNTLAPFRKQPNLKI